MTCFFFFGLMLTAFDAVSVMLFVKLPLLVSFSHDYGLVTADVEHHVATSWWEPWDQRETQRVR
jgi:hypothetical protein